MRLICHVGCDRRLSDLANSLSPEGLDDYTAATAGIHLSEDQ
jgi:hypothetical protein